MEPKESSLDTRSFSARIARMPTAALIAALIAGCLALTLLSACGRDGSAPDGASESSPPRAEAAAVDRPAVEPSPQPAGEEGDRPPARPVATATPAVRGPAPVALARPTPTPLPAADLPALNRTVNVLVLGSDRRPRMPNWRTDVIMIVAMDLEKGEAAVISLPRDIYMDRIPGHQPNRINAVDYLGERDEPGGGGPRLLASLLEEKLKIPIHHYIRFEFSGFQDVVDALGGVTIPVDCPVSEYYPEEDIYLRLQPGEHRLNGPQALSYVRTRRQGGDLERARRQQRVVWALRGQLVQENVLPKVPALYGALRNAVQTDVGLIDAVRYARFALSLDEQKVHGMVVSPPDMIREGWAGGMFIYIANWERIASQIHTVFERPPLVETNTVGETGDRPRCP